MDELNYNYDVIVIGGGISGCMAACTTSSFGLNTLIISISMDSVANMQFGNKLKLDNDLLNLDNKTGILKELIYKYSILDFTKYYGVNKNFKGFHLIDKKRFSLGIKELIESLDNLSTRQGLVTDIEYLKKGFIVKTSDYIKFKAKSIVISTGTNLNAVIKWGNNKIKGGRPGEIHSFRLYENLKNMNIKFRKCKNMVAPVILNDLVENKLEKTINGLEKNIINYTCELKEYNNINLFPEGRDTKEFYVYGFENNFSEDKQIKILRSIKGLETAILTRPGYKIEYSCLDPKMIKENFESCLINGLFFTGRVTGIKSYNESIKQGIIAGINIKNNILSKKL